jgi:hypothetical protein
MRQEDLARLNETVDGMSKQSKATEEELRAVVDNLKVKNYQLELEI